MSTDVGYPASTADPHTAPGQVVSAALPKDEPVPDNLERTAEDDEEDIVKIRSRAKQANGIPGIDLEEKSVEEEEDDGDDLFGDDPEDDDARDKEP